MRLLAGTRFDRPPHCEKCDLPESDCRCTALTAKANRVSPESQTARLSIEKRKKGKLVTVVRGLAAADNDFPELLTRLKTVCAAGGTIEGDLLVVQGEQLDRVKQALTEHGYKVR